MRAIGDLLGEVLANTAKLVAERKGGIHAAVGARGEHARKGAGGPADRFQVPAETYTADGPLPAQREQVPKTAAGNKRTEVQAAELFGGVHDSHPADTAAKVAERMSASVAAAGQKRSSASGSK